MLDMIEIQEKETKRIRETALKNGYIGKTELIAAYGSKSIMGGLVNLQFEFENLIEDIYYEKIKMSGTLKRSLKSLKKHNDIESFTKYIYNAVRGWK